MINKISNFIGNVIWPRLLRSSSEDDSTFSTREKVLVFTVAYGIALGLWLMVNLDRDFVITLDLPVVQGTVADNQALLSPIPASLNVGISGVGWKLINLYNNPPTVSLNLQNGTINLFEQVRDALGPGSDFNITKVQPSILNVNLEERLEKRVPVDLRMDINFRSQFGFVGPISIQPDSVTLSGARSRVQGITSWPTVILSREGLRDPLNTLVPMESTPEVISIDTPEIRVIAAVAEFTEGELRVPVVTRGLPRGRLVSYTPTHVLVRYSVPIDEYEYSVEQVPFVVYVPYAQIMSDSTGVVMPTVETNPGELNVRLRTVTPRSISYFLIVNE
jgi:hypothetical protein